MPDERDALRLESVERWTQIQRRALRTRNLRIRQAHQGGWSYRKIAAAAGMSHSNVAKIVHRGGG